MPGRKFTSADYRFSVNGTEKSPEIGSGHNTTYFRELDSRTGRWWSTDPVWHPWQSNYSTFDNNPVALSDPSGAATGRRGGSLGRALAAVGEYLLTSGRNSNPGSKFYSWSNSQISYGVQASDAFGPTGTKPGGTITKEKVEELPKMRETTSSAPTTIPKPKTSYRRSGTGRGFRGGGNAWQDGEVGAQLGQAVLDYMLEQDRIAKEKDKKATEYLKDQKAKKKWLEERGLEYEEFWDGLVIDDYDPEEENKKRWNVYITLRDLKQKKWGVTDQPLFYVGIYEQGTKRYTSGDIEDQYIVTIFEGITKGEARGVEQLLIELNNNGSLDGLSTSPYLDNYKRSTALAREIELKRRAAGLMLLNSQVTDWRTRYYKSRTDALNYYNRKTRWTK